jgi:hypothetical protein
MAFRTIVYKDRAPDNADKKKKTWTGLISVISLLWFVADEVKGHASESGNSLKDGSPIITFFSGQAMLMK